MFLPRFEGAEDSVASGIIIERIAPTPAPEMKRKMQIEIKLGTKAAIKPAIEFNVIPARSIGRRPI